MKKCIYPLFLFTGIILIACNPYRYIDIQVLKPANIVLPYKLHRLYILNSTIVNLDTSQRIPNKVYQRLQNSFYTKFINELKGSSIFSGAPISFISLGSIHDEIDTIPFNERKHIYTVSIKSIGIFDSLYKKRTNMDGSPCKYCNYYVQQYSFQPTFEINISNLAFNRTIDNYFVKDTFILQTEPYFYTDSLRADIGKYHKEVACTESAEEAARIYVKRMAATWQMEERGIYYSHNYLMRKAYRYFEKNDIDNAMDTWKQVYESGTHSIASKAAYNIGICYETQDNIEKALLWLKKAQDAKQRKFTAKYLKTIQNRVAENDSLDIQINKPK